MTVTVTVAVTVTVTVTVAVTVIVTVTVTLSMISATATRELLCRIVQCDYMFNMASWLTGNMHAYSWAYY